MKSAPGTIGKIQVGAEPGGSAQVIVPPVGVPLAAGTEPNAPDVELIDPLPELLVEQAASPRAAAAAAANTASVFGRIMTATFRRGRPHVAGTPTAAIDLGGSAA